MGKTIRVPESQQDAVTALSGSGPAYFYFLVEAMVDAGILLGLPRATAHELIVQSAVGAGVMLRDSGSTGKAARGGDLARGAPAIARIRELSGTACARRCSRRWRRPGTAPRNSPRATEGSRGARPRFEYA